jgi:hypothetical protein
MRLTGLFEEVMLVMDCCAEVSGPTPELLCHLPYNGNVALAPRPFLHIYAAVWNATTSEKLLPDPLDPRKPASWQGVLTNTLLRGLTTAGNSAGEITSISVQNFIQAEQSAARIDSSHTPKPMVFGASSGVPVNVSLRNGAARFQVRDGLNLQVFAQPQPAPATVMLQPGLWLFDSMDAEGRFTESQPVSVREGGTSVLI